MRDLLVQLIVIVGVLYLIAYLANYYRIRWTNQLGQNVIYDIRKHLFTHVQSFSNNFFDQRSAGSILVRIMNDTGSLQDLFTNGVINILMDLIMLVGIIVILFSLSPYIDTGRDDYFTAHVFYHNEIEEKYSEILARCENHSIETKFAFK